MPMISRGRKTCKIPFLTENYKTIDFPLNASLASLIHLKNKETKKNLIKNNTNGCMELASLI
jgi:hypothetical protein